MSDRDYLIDLLYSEKYLFDFISAFIKNIESDNYHDFCLGIFDDIDEIIRNLNKLIISDNSCDDDLLNYFVNKINYLQKF